jgi:hypothetical protein
MDSGWAEGIVIGANIHQIREGDKVDAYLMSNGSVGAEIVAAEVTRL